MLRTTLILLLLVSYASSALAFNANSLTWQKLALEEKVERKFTNTISTVLKDNQYLVQVDVEMSEPGAPNFGNDNQHSGPRVSDLNITESRGDYIAFSKVGLEVPVVEKFLDEDRTKLMNMYRFNEAYDLFKNLAGVNVTVFLSDKLPQDLVEVVKRVVNSSKLSVSGIKPSVKFETMSLEWIDPTLAKKAEEEARKKAEEEKKKKKEEEKEPKIWKKDWYEWASRWGNAVGLILTALILGTIAFVLFRMWKNFMEKYAELMAKKPENAKPEETGEKLPDELQVTMSNEQDQTKNLEEEELDMATQKGFERFQQCLNHHPDDAVNMVRFWINDGEEGPILALRAISQLSTPEELEKIMNSLSASQRDSWKGFLGKHLDGQELVAANKYIFQEVVKTFLVPSRIKDSEILNIIMDLNVKAICDFFGKFEDQIGILLNILSPSVIGKLLMEVDDETAEAWLLAGSEFPMAEMDQRVPTLKEALKSYLSSSAPSPFAQRILAMIPTAAPSREGTLFRALAKAGNSGMIMDAAKKNFPGELVLSMPPTFLKEVLQSYPVNKRVELLYSRPEEVKANLLNLLAEKGTPARDMLDMELEGLERDQTRGAAIQGQAEEMWGEFVKSSRTFLAKNVSYAGYADQLVKEWSQKLGQGLTAIKGGKEAA